MSSYHNKKCFIRHSLYTRKKTRCRYVEVGQKRIDVDHELYMFLA